MREIETLTDNLRFREARKEAERKLREDFSEENFLSLLDILLTVGDMRTTARYLHI